MKEWKFQGTMAKKGFRKEGNSAGFWWKSIWRGRGGKNSKNKEQYDRKHKIGHAHILLKGELSKLARAAGLWARKDWPGQKENSETVLKHVFPPFSFLKVQTHIIFKNIFWYILIPREIKIAP